MFVTTGGGHSLGHQFKYEYKRQILTGLTDWWVVFNTKSGAVYSIHPTEYEAQKGSMAANGNPAVVVPD